MRGVRRVRDPPDVHQLDDDPSTLGMDGIGHLAPSIDVLAGVGARRQQIALPVVAGLGALGDDQRHRGALRVVLDVHRRRHAVRR